MRIGNLTRALALASAILLPTGLMACDDDSGENNGDAGTDASSITGGTGGTLAGGTGGTITGGTGGTSTDAGTDAAGGTGGSPADAGGDASTGDAASNG